MSQKGEKLSKKKGTINPGRPETEDTAPPVTPRKRKVGRMADRDLASSAHEVGRHTERTPRGIQGRRRFDLVPVQSTALARQRQRHPQTLSAHRRMSVDVHHSRRSNPGSRTPRTRAASVPTGPPRTMLQHAWHTVLNSDPLMDSDEECPDEHLWLDYNRRMQVIARLRGRPPTPTEPAECGQPNLPARTDSGPTAALVFKE